MTLDRNNIIFILGGIFSLMVSLAIFEDLMEVVLFTTIGIFCFCGYWFYVIVGRYEKFIEGKYN